MLISYAAINWYSPDGLNSALEERATQGPGVEEEERRPAEGDISAPTAERLLPVLKSDNHTMHLLNLKTLSIIGNTAELSSTCCT